MPRVKLQDRMVAGLDGAEGRVDYWDALVPGLVLRVSAERKAWCAVYRVGGKKDRLTFGTYPLMSIHDARERAAEILRKAQRGEDPKTAEAPGPMVPLSEVARRFRERAFPDLAASTQKEWGRLIDVEILPVLGALDATDVKSARRQIRDATDAIKRRSAYTANRTWEVVRRMIGWGIERDFLDPVASAVFTNFPRPAEEKRRDRVLTHDEIRRVFEALRHEPPVTAIFWRLAFYTGQRRGEILGARWDAFELERALWTFRTKGDKPHVLGLPRQVIAVLREACLSSHTPYVCSGPAVCGHLYNPQKSAARVRKRSGVAFRSHDVRRTVASGLGEIGIDEGLISRILNHSTSSTTGASVTAAVYNQYKYVEPMRQALQAWADQLDAIVTRPQAEVVPMRSESRVRRAAATRVVTAHRQ
jgi:integrase